MKHARILGLLVVLLAAPSMAYADDKAEAAQMYRAGTDRFMRRDFEGARAAFLQAYSLDPLPRYLWDLALSEHNLNLPVDALGHFRKYLSLPAVDDEHRRKARRPMGEAEAKTGHAVLDVPPGAVVTADGRELTLYADHTIDFLPGKHTIEARSGTSKASAVIEAKAGETVHPDLRFEAPPPLAPVAQAPSPLPPTPSLPEEPPHAPAPVGSSSSTAKWITAGAVGGVGVASLVISGVFFANASGQNDTIQSASAQAGVCPQPPTTPQCINLANAVNAKANDENLGRGFLIGGGLLVAGAIVTVLVWPRAHDVSSVGFVAPVALPGGGGALWTGSFE
jgi:hypothetical protein